MNEWIVTRGIPDAESRPAFRANDNRGIVEDTRSVFRNVQLVLKFTTDIAVGFVCLVLASPVMVLTAIAIRWNLGSPVLFKQPRVGLNGKIFMIYKFRTMVHNVDTCGNQLPDTLRTTRLGHLFRRFKLDELPQLFQVLAGRMSLVGPRPFMPLPNEASKIQPGIHYALPQGGTELDGLRRQVKPGITGWSQVNGNAKLSLINRMELDAWYVRHFSFALDIKILFMTLLVLVNHEQVNNVALAEAQNDLPADWRFSALEVVPPLNAESGKSGQ